MDVTIEKRAIPSATPHFYIGLKLVIVILMSFCLEDKHQTKHFCCLRAGFLVTGLGKPGKFLAFL